MLDAITKSLKSVAESVTYRKNTFEFLGYDFMIDTKFNPWLIEINTSPSMEYSTVKNIYYKFYKKINLFKI